MKRLLCGLLAALMLCGCTALPAGTSVPPTTTVPATTAGPALKAGYYIYDGEYRNDTQLHFLISEDGTGYLSMLGIRAELTWTPDGEILGLGGDPMSFTPTADGMLWDGERFTWVGERLPEGFIPDPPAPGVYAVSSVGLDGDVDFYGKLSRDNGYLEIREDGTGVMAFDGTEYPFTLEGTTAHFDGFSLMLLDRSGQDTGGEDMVMVYVTAGPIRADSIVFRKLEE